MRPRRTLYAAISGGLAGYVDGAIPMFRGAATVVDKIHKGTTRSGSTFRRRCSPPPTR